MVSQFRIVFVVGTHLKVVASEFSTLLDVDLHRVLVDVEDVVAAFHCHFQFDSAVYVRLWSKLRQGMFLA